MPDFSGFLFGRKALDKAAGKNPAPPPPPQPAGIDIAKMAQDQADKAAAAKKTGALGIRGVGVKK